MLLVGYLANFVDLGMLSRNGACSYVGRVLYMSSGGASLRKAVFRDFYT